MMVRAVTFEHDGVLYEVRDFRYDGVRRSWVELNSSHAEGRIFHARDGSQPDRIYVFRGGINYQTSDPETLAIQFKHANVVR